MCCVLTQRCPGFTSWHIAPVKGHCASPDNTGLLHSAAPSDSVSVSRSPLPPSTPPKLPRSQNSASLLFSTRDGQIPLCWRFEGSREGLSILGCSKWTLYLARIFCGLCSSMLPCPQDDGKIAFFPIPKGKLPVLYQLGQTLKNKKISCCWSVLCSFSCHSELFSSHLIFLKLYLFFGPTKQHVGSYFLNQGLNPCPLNWKRKSQATPFKQVPWQEFWWRQSAK